MVSSSNKRSAMSFSSATAFGVAFFFIHCCATYFICHTVDVLYFAESFSLPPLQERCQVKSHNHQLMYSTNGGDAEDGQQNLTATNLGGVDETITLLACRAYLRRKHKIEWTAKRQRAEAASSPLNNEGYFWYDPNELMYLREDPDPYNLNYNETDIVFGSNGRRERKAGPEFVRQIFEEEDYLKPEPIPEVTVAFSTNPFSTIPLNPTGEHVRRSSVKDTLWSNETWKELWYKRRWGGKKLTHEKKSRKRREQLLDSIPSDVLDSPTFDQMSEDEVMEAIVTYLNSNERRSESRKKKKLLRSKHRQVTREWKRNVKQKAIECHDANATRVDLSRKERQASTRTLSFTPSVETMKKLRAKRSEQSKRAFQTRLMNTNSSETSSSKEMAKLRRNYEKEDSEYDSDDISPIQAILRIDMALDHNMLPSASDVGIMLKPGRLGRRRFVLRRILNDCFDLRGKCVPSSDVDKEGDLLFVTKCTIDELGSFVLSKMSEKESNNEEN